MAVRSVSGPRAVAAVAVVGMHVSGLRGAGGAARVRTLLIHPPSIADMTSHATGSPLPVQVRDAAPDDLPAMAAIYDEQVRTSVATFDTEPRGTAYLGEKLAHAGGGDLVLVAHADAEVVGYAFSGPFRPRPAYDGTKEVSVYVASAARGRGVARALYAALLERLDELPQVHTQVAVVALPNDASEALHLAFGFRQVGVLREVGRKFDRWVDTAWYQRMA